MIGIKANTRESDHCSWYTEFRESTEKSFEYDTENKQAIKEERLRIELNNQIITELPSKLKELYEGIEQSKYILESEIDEEDEKSDIYKPETWIRAIKFIVDYAIWHLDFTNHIVDAPDIYDGPDGTIDILWEKPNYRILINIPDLEKSRTASFYGDDYKFEEVKGKFNPEDYNKCLFLGLLSKN